MNKKAPGLVDDDSLETQLMNTRAQVVGTFQKLFSMPSSERAEAENSSETSRTREMGEEGEETKTKNEGAIDQDSLEAQFMNTKAQVVGTFEKLFDPNSAQDKLDAVAAAFNPSRGKGGEMKNHGPNDDDSFDTQVKNTEAHVYGTFQELSKSLEQAGEKIKGAFGGASDEHPTKKD